MAIITSTSVKSLTEELRIDPEFYQPFYIENERKLLEIGGKHLGIIAEIVYGTTPAGGVFEELGVPFLRSQNFSNNIVEDGYVYCSAKFHAEHKNSKCLPNDILFAAIGATIGDFAIVPPWVNEGNTNQNIARIRVTDADFSPEYIWAFFLTNYGQLQLKRYPTGNAQPYLNTFQFNRFLIPKLKNQEKIKVILRDVFDLIEETKKLYPEAEQELLDRMGWDQIDSKHVLSYQVSNKDFLSNERIDPEFYQPKFEKLKIHLQKIGARKLISLCPVVKRGASPSYDENGGVVIVNSQNLGADGIIDVTNLEKCNIDFYNETKNKNAQLKKFDVLTYATGAYIGRTNSWMENEKAIAGIDCIISQPNTKICNSVYLSLFLNSPAGLMQSNQHASESAQRHLYPKDIKEYQVFIPEKNGRVDLDWQEELANKVLHAYEAKKQAKNKLREAKELVETEIEKLIN